MVHHLVVLARGVITAELRPHNVRRGLANRVSLLGTSARLPKPRGKAKGRESGVKLSKRMRFPVVRKKPSVSQFVST